MMEKLSEHCVEWSHHRIFSGLREEELLIFLLILLSPHFFLYVFVSKLYEHVCYMNSMHHNGNFLKVVNPLFHGFSGAWLDL